MSIETVCPQITLTSHSSREPVSMHMILSSRIQKADLPEGAECKKHKIKCFVQPGEMACNKCVKSGIACVPHNFAQKFLDEDTTWKAEANMTLAQLKAAVQHLLELNNLPKLEVFVDSETSPVPGATVQTLSPSITRFNGIAPGNFISEGPSADRHEDDSDLVPLPMNNLYNLRTCKVPSHPCRSYGCQRSRFYQPWCCFCRRSRTSLPALSASYQPSAMGWCSVLPSGPPGC